MSSMQQISVSLTGLGTKKTKSAGLPEVSTLLPVQQHISTTDKFSMFDGIPGIEVIRNTPGVEPFMVKGLIPDVFYLATQGRLAEAIARADPKNPRSLIYNDPSQLVHIETQKTEMDILTGQIDIFESDEVCINPKCRKKTVSGPYIKQRSSADEPPHASFKCMTCKQIWHMKMA